MSRSSEFYGSGRVVDIEYYDVSQTTYTPIEEKLIGERFDNDALAVLLQQYPRSIRVVREARWSDGYEPGRITVVLEEDAETIAAIYREYAPVAWQTNAVADVADRPKRHYTRRAANG